jgi:hypothetical protein
MQFNESQSFIIVSVTNVRNHFHLSRLASHLFPLRSLFLESITFGSNPDLLSLVLCLAFYNSVISVPEMHPILSHISLNWKLILQISNLSLRREFSYLPSKSIQHSSFIHRLQTNGQAFLVLRWSVKSACQRVHEHHISTFAVQRGCWRLQPLSVCYCPFEVRSHCSLITLDRVLMICKHRPLWVSYFQIPRIATLETDTLSLLLLSSRSIRDEEGQVIEMELFTHKEARMFSRPYALTTVPEQGTRWTEDLT